MKARREIISAALGRDVSEKDVRTDVNYNLIMTGLLVAAGESPNAMTNIAKGLAAGLAGYGKAKGEATEAKRKEDIAVGLAAVEQTFKETEAEKSRDKKPETIRTAEYLRDNPELLSIIRGMSSKNKSDEQIKLEIATALARSAIDPSAIDTGTIDMLFKAVKGQIQTPQTPTVIPSYRIPQNVVGTDRFKPGNRIPRGGFDYIVSDDGLTLNLDTTKKSS